MIKLKKTEFFGLEKKKKKEKEEKKEMDGSIPSGDPRQREKSNMLNTNRNFTVIL